MSETIITNIWLILGILMMLAELVVPGLMVIFLGFSALLVGALRWIGWIDSLAVSFIIWAILSTLLVLVYRKFFTKLLPGETSVGSTSEMLDAFGNEVEVLEPVDSNNHDGRIRYQGITWNATTNGKPIQAGEKAKIVSRTNTVWVIDSL